MRVVLIYCPVEAILKIPSRHSFPLRHVALAADLCANAGWAAAQANAPAPAGAALPTVTVEASADASAAGLAPAFSGGQVATGGRVGILGTQDNLSTPFATTSFTNELIQNQQAKSVGDVLENDPSIRVARGFGNFQESYFIRGFVLGSDSVAYNGLYGMLPRQYISSELFERVEVLRGPSAFLNGAAPGGDAIGGAVSLLPKRAGNEPLTQLTLGGASGGQFYGAVDIGRRFGEDQSLGIRVNAARRDGGTGVDHEDVDLSMASIGMDWRGRNARISADVGYQDHRLRQARANVTPATSGAGAGVPTPPDASTNWAQPWSYSNENDTFGTVRAEVDLSDNVTAWGAAGMRRGAEGNTLANFSLTDAGTGAGTTYRFDNTRHEDVKTGELGVRGKFHTGSVSHSLVGAYSYFSDERENAFGYDNKNEQVTNLYRPIYSAFPGWSSGAVFGNDLDNPALQYKSKLWSFAVGDTLGFLNDRLLLTLGARYQKLDTQSFGYTTGVPAPAYGADRTSPLAGVVYKFTDTLSAYANYVEALSEGDTAPALSNGRTVLNVGDMLAPYVSKQKEIGVKYEGGGIGASAAFFSIDKPRAFVDDAGYFSAAGEDQHQGLEFNVYGEPVRGLRLLGGVTFLDAKQKETGDPALDGNRVIGVPRQQGTLGLEWDVPGVQGLTLEGRMVASGSSYADDANNLRVAGWSRFDAGARYLTEVGGKLLTIRGRVENLADRNYWASVGGYPGAGYLVLGNPRTFTLTASMEF